MATTLGESGLRASSWACIRLSVQNSIMRPPDGLRFFGPCLRDMSAAASAIVRSMRSTSAGVVDGQVRESGVFALRHMH